jgi:hypothetical protein
MKMRAFNDKIKIYKFDGLGKLKEDHFYDDYLIVCYDGNEKVWYLLENKILWDSYKIYFKEKLGITDSLELQMLLDKYNNAVKNKSYETLKAKNFKFNKYIGSAATDKGIRLSTKIAKGCRGMLWKEMIKRKLIKGRRRP